MVNTLLQKQGTNQHLQFSLVWFGLVWHFFVSLFLYVFYTRKPIQTIWMWTSAHWKVQYKTVHYIPVCILYRQNQSVSYISIVCRYECLPMINYMNRVPNRMIGILAKSIKPRALWCVKPLQFSNKAFNAFPA